MTVPDVTPVDQPTCLAGAIECGKRGFRVFPVHSVRGTTCTCQGWLDKNDMGPCEHPGKHPRFRNWQERATTDPVAIEEFWWNHKGANVAIATGAGSGIFVLDIDVRNGGGDSLDTLIHQHGRMPDTLEAVTGSRRHFYFQHPGVTVPNMVGLLPGIDVRGDGGLVVAPPSIHVSGNQYFWDGMDGLESDIAAAPAWLLEIIMGKHPASERVSSAAACWNCRRTIRIPAAVGISGIPGATF